MFGIRGFEWVIILVIILLLLGPSKLPSLARAIGKSISEFRSGVKSSSEDDKKKSDDDANPGAKS